MPSSALKPFKGSLADILAMLDDMDSTPQPVPAALQASLGEALAAKVDATKDVLDELEFQAERLRIASAKLAEGKRQILARVDRLYDYMAFHMKERAFEQIPGELWKARLTSSEAVKPVMEADATKYPQFIRLKAEWDLAALKDALKAGDPAAQEVARLVTTNSVAFSVNKGRIK